MRKYLFIVLLAACNPAMIPVQQKARVDTIFSKSVDTIYKIDTIYYKTIYQQTPVNNYISTNTFTGSGTQILKHVKDFKNFDATTAVIQVLDENTGGLFQPYTGTDEPDGGMIFKDKLNRKWLRQAQGIVNVGWYGASANLSATGARVDTRNLFIAARDYIYNHPSKFTTLYIPADTSGLYTFSGAGKYFISDSILFTKSIKILGEGTIGFPTSKIVFPPHTTGLVFKPIEQYGFSVDIQNLGISCDYDPPFNVKKHAITTQVLSHFNNINVEQFDGDGVHITACASWPNGDNNNYGNSDGSTFENITATFCTNGIFIEGCDANTIHIINSSTNQCRRWGIFDNGFLGNLYTKPHAAFNGVPAVSGNAVVSFGGKYYAATPGHDGYFGDAPDSNFNKQPDLNPLFWYEVTGMGSTAWNATTRYYSGGPINIQNTNAWSNILNAYTEGFQPPINLNTRSKVDGGDNGAGVRGSYHQILFGAEYIYNADLILPNGTNQHRMTIGGDAPDYSTVLKIYNDWGKSQTAVPLKLETNISQVYLGMKNSTGTSAVFGYSNKDLVTYVDNVMTLKQTTTGSLTKVNILSTDPTTDNIELGFTGVFINTSTNVTSLWANVGGKLFKTVLQSDIKLNSSVIDSIIKNATHDTNLIFNKTNK